MTAPALAATLALQLKVPFATMLFEGGRDVFVLNISEAILFPYVAVFMLALGTLSMRPLPQVQDRALERLDIQMVRFYCGAALLTLVGAALGVASLLYSWICIPVFWFVLYAYFLRKPQFFLSVRDWIMARDEPVAGRSRWHRFATHISAALRVFFALSSACLLLALGTLPDIRLSDNVQLYFPYLAEVAFLHSTWLDPGHPVYSDFLIGRGNGVHLFFATFTTQFFGQVISIVYLIAIPLIAARSACLMIPAASESIVWQTARRFLPDCAMVLCLFSPILGIGTAKYHLQTGSFLFFLSWSSLLFLFVGKEWGRWLFRSLVPVAIAIPVMLPQYEALALLSLAIAAAAVAWVRNIVALRHIGFLIVIGVCTAAVSLGFNQLYLGIAELNPASLFLKYADLEKMRQWTSPSLIEYLNLTQNVIFFDSGQTWSNLRSAFDRVPDFRTGRAWRQALVASVYAGSLTYLIFVFLRRSVVASSSTILSNSVTSPARLFIAAFLVPYAMGQLVLQLTYLPSAIRLLQFQYAYLAVGWIALFVLIAGFRYDLRAAAPGLRSSKEHFASRPLLVAFVLASIITYSAITFLAFPFSNKYAITLLAMAILTYWAGRKVANPSASPAFRSVLAFLGTAANRLRRRWGIPDAAPKEPGVDRVGGKLVFLTLIAGGSLYVAVWQAANVWYPNFSAAFGSPVDQRAVRYFLGLEGLARSVRKEQFNFERCLEIGRAVPEDARILPLNAYEGIVPCHNSPLLPRNAIVHHYESILAPHFDVLAFGSPEQATQIMRKFSVNYFYVEKGDTDFFGPAFGALFSADNLEDRFDVYWDAPGFLILTWRGGSGTPVTRATAMYIDWLRQEGCASPQNIFIENCAGFFRLKAGLRSRNEK